jgi:osmoprotectant transport system permease protein
VELLNQMLEVLVRESFVPDLRRHVELSVFALLAGVAISLPVAVAVNRSSLASVIAINVGNIGRAVPSLAILALALPLFGFGFTPSLIALIALAIPPILINAVTGLKEVNAQVIDAARGMGLSGLQIMSRVQLPIAAPVIFAGIRTSAVQVVASATLATFIGGGGLGNLIVEGFQRGDTAIMLVGAFAVALLAVMTEFLFGGLERVFTPKGIKVAQQRAKK